MFILLRNIILYYTTQNISLHLNWYVLAVPNNAGLSNAGSLIK